MADPARDLRLEDLTKRFGDFTAVDGLNLEAAGVDYDNTVGIRVDDFLQTSNRRIYGAGDACLEHKFTHTADASARISWSRSGFTQKYELP